MSSISGSGGDEDGDKPGNSVTTYGDITIGSLKKQLRKAINDLADELDVETKEVPRIDCIDTLPTFLFAGNTCGECSCV